MSGAPRDEAADTHMMFSFKVTPCPIRHAHDWVQCPNCHPGERARRRHPSTHTGIACLSMRQEGSCSLGDACPFAHNVFEYWLHPTRYHTALCKNGAACTRPSCFFPHHPWELRTNAPRPMLPPQSFQDPRPERQPAAGCAPPGDTASSSWPRCTNAQGGSSRVRPCRGSTEGRSAGTVGLGAAGKGALAGVAAAGLTADPWDAAATLNSSTWSTGSSSPSGVATPLQDPATPLGYYYHGLGAALPAAAPPLTCELAPTAELLGSWGLMQAVDEAMALGRMDSYQAALVLAHLLPQPVLLQLKDQLQGRLGTAPGSPTSNATLFC